MTWGAVAGAAITVVGGYIANKNNKKSQKQISQAQGAMDPYGPYRDAAAQKLNNLMNNPDSISNTAEYKSRLTAAQRAMAAQGYTGSGNALVAAANAGGDAYQQAFNNLALLSGAGGQPGAGAMQGAALAQQGRQNTLNNYSDVANSAIYAGQKLWNNYQSNQAWNTPIDTGSVSMPDYSQSVDPGYTISDSNYNPPPVQAVSV